jgi:hypothetical protein
MKKIIAWPLCWTFFWMGDLISWVMNNLDWGWLYPAYNKLMTWSIDIQDWGGLKSPWRYSDGV